jgi:ribonuclease E
VWLPSGGSLVIDRTEAMTVVDVNTGKFVGSGGNLEETVTKNNLEAAEEIVRQLRLRDIGGIIVVDFIDMVLETNRDLVLRRLVECLSRDRTKHQVAEVTSLGLVQMTRKKLGLGLLESFSEPCEVCAGRGIIVHHEPIMKHRAPQQVERRRGRGGNQQQAPTETKAHAGTHAITEDVKHALAQIAASTIPHAEQKPADTEAPAASREATGDRAAAEASSTTAAEQPSASSRRRGRHRRVTQEQGPAESTDAAAASAATEPDAPAATEPDAPEVAEASNAPAVSLVELPPLAPVERKRVVRVEDAEELLDSMLDALPAPKKPGEGRSRSRRVSTAALSPAGGPPVITRPDGAPPAASDD